MIYDEGSARFGVAGFPPNFFESEHGNKRENVFRWISEIGLNWIELQNTYGVKMKDEQAYLYKRLSEEYRVGISIHGPYFISLASPDSEVVRRSKERVLQCYALAEKLGARRIIFHPGYFSGKDIESRNRGLEQLIEALNSIESLLPNDEIFLYPETAGKKSQLGSVQEIITICKNVKFARPCIDVAHVHGFEGGALTSKEKILEILEMLEKELGRKMLEETHFHMYPIEYDYHGEKRHRAFHDRIETAQMTLFDSDNIYYDRYYPLPEHFIDAIKEKRMNPIVVCEARDSQDRGALLMKKLFYEREGMI